MHNPGCTCTDAAAGRIAPAGPAADELSVTSGISRRTDLVSFSIRRWFKRATAASPAFSHVIGLGLLAALVSASAALRPLALSLATTAVLVIVAAWETVSLRPRPGDPS